MKKPFWLLTVLLSGIACSLQPVKAQAAEVFHRYARSTLINDGWVFSMEGSGKETEISLPHDYSISQPFQSDLEAESGFLPGGTGIYEKKMVFEPAMKDSRVVVEWEGVYMNAQVSVNDTVLGTHPYGYTPFAFDISDYIVCDGRTENTIRVRTENTIPGSRWYSGSGIFRDVYLTVTPKQYFERYGITVTAPDLERQSSGPVRTVASVALGNNEASVRTVRVRTVIEDEKGNELSKPAEKAVVLSPGKSTRISMELIMESPELWQLGNGNEYICRCDLFLEDQRIDTVLTPFGYRWFRFDSERGFSLNGTPVKLQGVCLHHDQGSLGSAAYPGAIDRQLDLLQEMGVNAIRTSHNPADHHFLKECSRRGILVIEEAFDTWTNAKNHNIHDYSSIFDETISASNQILDGKTGTKWSEFDIRTMVRHSRNEPCVILYSIGNEILGNIGGDTSEYPRLASELCRWVKEEDGTRPVTIADNMTLTDNETQIAMDRAVIEAGGAVGLNYATGASMDRYHSQWPEWPLYGSETASVFGSRGEYSARGIDEFRHQITAFDQECVEWGMTARQSWMNTIERDYIAGEFVWTGFDYIGEPEPWNGLEAGSVTDGSPSPHSSYFGILDTAGFPKDSYYFYQSQWRNDLTVVHILPDWNRRNLNKTLFGKTRVSVYTNAPSIELFLNGKSLGKKTAETHVTENGFAWKTYDGSLSADWTVTWEEGKLSAVAYDEKGGVLKADSGRCTVSTSSDVADVSVTTEQYSQPRYGTELIYVSCSLQDADGNPVSDQESVLTLTLSGSGRILSSDNGNPCDLQPYQEVNAASASRSTFHGRALFILERQPGQGESGIRVTAGDSVSADVAKTGLHTWWQDIREAVFPSSAGRAAESG